MAGKSFKKTTSELFLTIPEPEKIEVEETQRKEIPVEYLPEPIRGALEKTATPEPIRAEHYQTRESKTKRVQLLMRPTTEKRLRESAQAQGISLNELINQIAEDYLEGKEA